MITVAEHTLMFLGHCVSDLKIEYLQLLFLIEILGLSMWISYMF